MGLSSSSSSAGTPQRLTLSSVNCITAYSQQKHAGVLSCRLHAEKGRVLHSERNIRAGENIFKEPPLIAVRCEPTNALYLKVEHLCEQHAFVLDPIWYWCALNSVYPETAPPREGLRTVDQQTRSALQLLHAPDAVSPSAEVKKLLQELQLEEYVTPEDLELMLQVWIHNCFEQFEDPVGFVIFFMPSFTSHSCLPNAFWYFDTEDNFVLRARTNIQVGEEISLSYLSEDDLLKPTLLRRQILSETKNFFCTCERCSCRVDFSRGFRCMRCGVGCIYVQPTAAISEKEAEEVLAAYAGKSASGFLLCGEGTMHEEEEEKDEREDVGRTLREGNSNRDAEENSHRAAAGEYALPPEAAGVARATAPVWWKAAAAAAAGRGGFEAARGGGAETAELHCGEGQSCPFTGNTAAAAPGVATAAAAGLPYASSDRCHDSALAAATAREAAAVVSTRKEEDVDRTAATSDATPITSNSSGRGAAAAGGPGRAAAVSECVEMSAAAADARETTAANCFHAAAAAVDSEGSSCCSNSHDVQVCPSSLQSGSGRRLLSRASSAAASSFSPRAAAAAGSNLETSAACSLSTAASSESSGLWSSSSSSACCSRKLHSSRSSRAAAAASFYSRHNSVFLSSVADEQHWLPPYRSEVPLSIWLLLAAPRSLLRSRVAGARAAAHVATAAARRRKRRSSQEGPPSAEKGTCFDVYAVLSELQLTHSGSSSSKDASAAGDSTSAAAAGKDGAAARGIAAADDNAAAEVTCTATESEERLLERAATRRREGGDNLTRATATGCPTTAARAASKAAAAAAPQETAAAAPEAAAAAPEAAAVAAEAAAVAAAEQACGGRGVADGKGSRSVMSAVAVAAERLRGDRCSPLQAAKETMWGSAERLKRFLLLHLFDVSSITELMAAAAPDVCTTCSSRWTEEEKKKCLAVEACLLRWGSPWGPDDETAATSGLQEANEAAAATAAGEAAASEPIAPREGAAAGEAAAREPATAREATAREAAAREATAREATAREVAAREATAREPAAAREATARGATAREATAREAAAAAVREEEEEAAAAGVVGDPLRRSDPAEPAAAAAVSGARADTTTRGAAEAESAAASAVTAAETSVVVTLLPTALVSDGTAGEELAAMTAAPALSTAETPVAAEQRRERRGTLCCPPETWESKYNSAAEAAAAEGATAEGAAEAGVEGAAAGSALLRKTTMREDEGSRSSESTAGVRTPETSGFRVAAVHVLEAAESCRRCSSYRNSDVRSSSQSISSSNGCSNRCTLENRSSSESLFDSGDGSSNRNGKRTSKSSIDSRGRKCRSKSSAFQKSSSNVPSNSSNVPSNSSSYSCSCSSRECSKNSERASSKERLRRSSSTNGGRHHREKRKGITCCREAYSHVTEACVHTSSWASSSMAALINLLKKPWRQLAADEKDLLHGLLFTMYNVHWHLACWLQQRLSDYTGKDLLLATDALAWQQRNLYPGINASLGWSLDSLSTTFLQSYADQQEKVPVASRESVEKLLLDERSRAACSESHFRLFMLFRGCSVVSSSLLHTNSLLEEWIAAYALENRKEAAQWVEMLRAQQQQHEWQQEEQLPLQEGQLKEQQQHMEGKQAPTFYCGFTTPALIFEPHGICTLVDRHLCCR